MRVHLSESLDDALAHKGAHPDLVPIAGGTDVFVHWPDVAARAPRDLLDLSRVAELRSVRFGDSHVEIGALATYWDVITDPRFLALPLLQHAARTVGAVQIQTRGTWAGNVANASPAADGVPVLMAYDAEVLLASAKTRRSVPLSRFYRGYKQMDMGADELIVALRVPRRDHDVEHFIKVGARAAQAITKVGVAVTHSAAGWRVVASAVAPAVCRCRSVEAQLASGASIESPAALLPALRQDVAPIDDIRSTAAYRLHVLSRVLYHALSAGAQGAA